MLEILAGGHRVQLLPERATYLPEHSILLVADAHFGKAQSFRRLGVPVPGGTTADNLARLTTALMRTGAGQLVFLGDLLHSRLSAAPAAWAQVQAFREAFAHVDMTLVRGNHDLHAGDPPPAWRIQCVADPLPLGALALAHHPDPHPDHYVLAGHSHPAAVLGGTSPGRLRLPCFHFGASVGVLPAFGDFTGMHVMPRRPGDRVFVVADDRVLPLPPLLSPP